MKCSHVFIYIYSTACPFLGGFDKNRLGIFFGPHDVRTYVGYNHDERPIRNSRTPLDDQHSYWHHTHYLDSSNVVLVYVVAAKTLIQSINQAINHSFNQPINQSANHSLIHSIIQSLNHSTNQSTNQPIKQSINQTINT